MKHHRTWAEDIYSRPFPTQSLFRLSQDISEVQRDVLTHVIDLLKFFREAGRTDSEQILTKWLDDWDKHEHTCKPLP